MRLTVLNPRQHGLGFNLLKLSPIIYAILMLFYCHFLKQRICKLKHFNAQTLIFETLSLKGANLLNLSRRDF